MLKTGEYSGLGVYHPDPNNDIDPPTDHEGSFTLSHVNPGALDLWVEADGRPTGHLAGLQLAPGGSLSGVEIRLEEGARVRGVVRWQGGAPIAGASISVGTESGSRRNTVSGVVSDGDGHFVVEGLRPGLVRLEAEEPSARHRGSLRLDERPEGGACVSLILPIAGAQSAPPESKTAPTIERARVHGT